ncbi:protein of unknown function [Xenorhabdus doucetiae]|uniref:Uncharacterized protein n=1 Tax=Xenorhabdus doucetiae TaxID=351671 RepID=A0A068QV25_9GAMM|nr:protein of unknown function [Xenorhabdus doucetiae]
MYHRKNFTDEYVLDETNEYAVDEY